MYIDLELIKAIKLVVKKANQENNSAAAIYCKFESHLERLHFNLISDVDWFWNEKTINVMDWIDKSNQMRRSYDGSIGERQRFFDNILYGQRWKRKYNFYPEILHFYLVSDVDRFWIDKTINIEDCTPASYLQSHNALYL